MIKLGELDLLIGRDRHYAAPRTAAALTASPCVCVQNYCVRGLELFASYLFQDILELYDWNLTGTTP